MFHVRLLVEYLWIVLQLREAVILAFPSPLFQSLVLKCPADNNTMVYWHHNGTILRPKRGKFLISHVNLEILDLREQDQGVYVCSSTKNEGDVIDHFEVDPEAPSDIMLQVHKDTVPLNASEELKDKLYWHPKMKRESSVVYMNFEPIVLSIYFYVSSHNLRPDVRWLPPPHFNPLKKKPSSPQVILCDDLEETQRPMSGTCFHASLDVPILFTGGEFKVEVSLPPESESTKSHSETQLCITFTVLKNILDRFLSREELESTDETPFSNHESFGFPALGIFDFPVIDEIRLLNKSNLYHKHPEEQNRDSGLSNNLIQTPRNEESTSPASGPIRPHPSAWIPRHKPPEQLSTRSPGITSSPSDLKLDDGFSGLNCSALVPSTHPKLEFFMHHSIACIGENQTVDCRFSQIPIQLELWFLRQIQPVTRTSQSCTEECNSLGCFDRPKLLKKSHVEEYRIVHQRSQHIDRVYQFHDNVAVTVQDLGPQHSGLYLCKAGQSYRSVTMAVRDCSASSLNLKPSILIITVLVLTTVMLMLPLYVCLRARRKSVIAIMSPSVFHLNVVPGSSAKKLTMVSRWNKLYPRLNGGVTSALLWSSVQNVQKKKNKQRPTAVQINSRIASSRGKQSRVFRPPMQLAPMDPRWEIPRAQIQIGAVLGYGCFGVVRSGLLRGPLPGSPCPTDSGFSTRKIAIKTLKTHYTQSELMDLLCELETMKLVHSHPHVIQLLGVCTQQQDCPLILMELAEYGNLRDYLRKRRSAQSDEFGEYILAQDSNASTVQSLGHELDTSLLLRFAQHVAAALAYFESLQLAHRDVAARNVLICSGYVAKLGDLGFARVIEDCYYDTDREQCPYKWMAPESIERGQYKLKSDVWSFGIFLWELFSLGEVPYPNVSVADLTGWLAAGNRNAQPLLADGRLFSLMRQCWEMEPEDRPGFQTIVKELAKYSLGTPPSPQRQLSKDSGCCSESRSCRSCSVHSLIFTEGHDTMRPVVSPKPVPPARTSSLLVGPKSSTGYVEMQSNEYLEPRFTLNLSSTDCSPV